MMSGVKAAILAIFVLLNLPYLVHSDCIKEQKNCTECYKQLVLDLMDTADNEYQLSTTFFPSTDDHPIIVTVEYCFVDISLECKFWYWSSGKMYVIQPPRILQFITLMFSDPALDSRIGTVTLTLPSHCESVKDDFMETLTYRLKLYAQQSLEHLIIPDTYKAMAYSVETMHKKLYKDKFYGWNTIALIYCTHFLFPLFVNVALLTVGCGYMHYTRIRNRNIEQRREESDKEGKEAQKCKERRKRSDQVTVASITILSVLITVYVIIMDILLIFVAYLDDKNTGSHDRFFTSDKPLFAFPAVVASSEIIVLVVTFFVPIYGPIPFIAEYDPMLRVFIASVLCVSTCISVHLPYIVSAWTTDSFHALTTLYWYIGALTVDFITCKYAFEFRISTRQPKNTHTPAQQYMNLIEFSDFVVTFVYVVVMTLPQIIIITYYVILPINESIEYASQDLSSIFNTFVLVITTVVAWKVLQLYPPWPHNARRTYCQHKISP